MEKHLDRIATAFERIAATFEAINHHGLEVYAKPSCFNLTLEGDVSLSLSGHLNLQGPLLLQHEFSDSLSISVYPPRRAESK